jgi:hypothetical protein
VETGDPKVSFEQDIRDHVLSVLPYDRTDFALVTELKGKSARELLIIYKNWLDRLIPAHPRIVHQSAAVQASPLRHDAKYKQPLEDIIEKVEKGLVLTPHLSRRIMHGYESHAAGNVELDKRKDLDLLVNDWRVHHLHLSIQVENDGFVKRTGPLLFGVFMPRDAYLIDIVEHGGWTRAHVLETLIKEWPNSGIVHEVKGAVGLSGQLTDGERKVLRNKAISAFFELDGKVYMPAGGLSTAGTSIAAAISADLVLRTIRSFQHELNKKPDFLKEEIEKLGLQLPIDPMLKFAFFDDGGFGIIEEKTGVRFRLGR